MHDSGGGVGSASFVEEHRATINIAILPAGLSDVLKWARAHLNQYLFNVLPSTQYLLLGYRDLELLTKYCNLAYQSPHLHLSVRCSLLLFKPEIGALIHAQVKQIWPRYLHLLFRGSIPVQVTDPSAKYSYRQGSFRDKNTDEPLTMNMILQVRIKSVGIHRGAYTIVCSMDDPEYRVVQRDGYIGNQCDYDGSIQESRASDTSTYAEDKESNSSVGLDRSDNSESWNGYEFIDNQAGKSGNDGNMGMCNAHDDTRQIDPFLYQQSGSD